MPWNARDGVGRLGSGIPKSDFWASAKEGIDQVGCVYTAPGFEFDYVGVIFGPDHVYRPMDGGWVGQRDQSSDRVVRSSVTDAEFTDFVKSTYRVLLTRGLRGCYVYFMDAPTGGDSLPPNMPKFDTAKDDIVRSFATFLLLSSWAGFSVRVN